MQGVLASHLYYAILVANQTIIQFNVETKLIQIVKVV